MAPVPVPEFVATTNGELADAYLDAVDALRRANAQLDALKTWTASEDALAEGGEEKK